jgi:hypothetical protein
MILYTGSQSGWPKAMLKAPEAGVLARLDERRESLERRAPTHLVVGGR